VNSNGNILADCSKDTNFALWLHSITCKCSDSLKLTIKPVHNNIVSKESNCESVLSLLLSRLGVHSALETTIANPGVSPKDWEVVISWVVSVSNTDVSCSLGVRLNEITLPACVSVG